MKGMKREEAYRLAMRACEETWNEKTCKQIREALEQEPFMNKPCVVNQVCHEDKVNALDKIRAEIMDCLKALDEIEKSGLNIYLPNEITGRRLTYQQCLGFIDKYKAESEEQA